MLFVFHHFLTLCYLCLSQQLTHSSIGVVPERVIDKYLDFPWNVKAGSNRYSLNCKNGPGVYRLS
jgi:hypothetical protein